MTKKHDLPPTVTVGHKDYTLERVKEPLVSSGALAWGEHSSAQSTIKICESAPAGSTEAEIVLHEVLHALFDHFNLTDSLKLRTADEEQLVDTLARGVIMVLKQNPSLITYISKTVKG